VVTTLGSPPRGTPPDPEADGISFQVAEGEDGERLDRLVTLHTKVGRRRVAELFQRGAVRVRGRVVKKSVIARNGDEVTVRLGPLILPEPLLPLDVRLETTHVVVANKPAGQPTAPARDGDAGTLAGAFLARYPEMAGVGYRAREPGLLHRLDTGTSGLVVAARSARVFTLLRRGLGEGRIEKHYLAVVLASGLPESGTITARLEPDRRDARRVVVIDEPRDTAAPRVTHHRTLRVEGSWALVEVLARHAYRHQVRVHLASIGHPIAGDALYGGPLAPLPEGRHALHASYVAWAGEADVPAFAVDCPLPEDFAAFGFPL
jgi:23S rRNA pseudouridine1911/1915/1917 synthase